MHLDPATFFINILSSLPWWFFIILVLAILLQPLKSNNTRRRTCKNQKNGLDLIIERVQKNMKKRKKRQNSFHNFEDTKPYARDIEVKSKQNSTGYNSFYKQSPTRQKMSSQQKKKKGDEYETYVANYFKQQGWTVWEHGKEKGVKDSSIDLIIKKDNFIYFVQCKNWETWKINDKNVKATRTDVRDYLKKNKDFWNLIKGYQMKILYVSPKNSLTKGAYRYIKENQDIIEYKVIPRINN